MPANRKSKPTFALSFSHVCIDTVCINNVGASTVLCLKPLSTSLDTSHNTSHTVCWCRRSQGLLISEMLWRSNLNLGWLAWRLTCFAHTFLRHYFPSVSRGLLRNHIDKWPIKYSWNTRKAENHMSPDFARSCHHHEGCWRMLDLFRSVTAWRYTFVLNAGSLLVIGMMSIYGPTWVAPK